MEYFQHPLLKPNSIERRLYQETIFASAVQKNTLVVLPTGLGKTALAALVAAHRLHSVPKSKVMFLAPTRPLVEQHKKTFGHFFNIPEDEMQVVTGTIQPGDREYVWSSARIVFATPQVVENDIQNGNIDLSDYSLLVIDETHRAVGDYAYPFVAKMYDKLAKNPLILGLTASPGGTEAKITEICDNLLIRNVEIRTDEDPDVKPYLKELDIEWRKVELPQEMKKIKVLLELMIKKRTDMLKEKGYIQTNRRSDVIQLQNKLSIQLRGPDPNPAYYHIIATCAEVVKLEHALGLIETQGIFSLREYFEKMKVQKAKSAQRLLREELLQKAIGYTNELFENKIKHPKIAELQAILYTTFTENPNARIIIFANYRDAAQEIFRLGTETKGCKPTVLVGQSSRGTNEGMSQKQQIEKIEQFEDGQYNTLICTSIGEEGLHISTADLAIFYETVASEVRNVQRRGRVGRTKIGKVIVLMTEGSRDVTYQHAARRKENKMRSVLREMRDSGKLGKERQNTLIDYAED